MTVREPIPRPIALDGPSDLGDATSLSCVPQSENERTVDGPAIRSNDRITGSVKRTVRGYEEEERKVLNKICDHLRIFGGSQEESPPKKPSILQW